jgi:hypothetical protein
VGLNARRFAVAVLSAAALAAGFGGCAIQFESSDAATGAYTIGGTVVGTGGESTGAGGGGGGSNVNRLGYACAVDADCGGALTCINASENDAIFGGGPAGGLCSKTCNADVDCPGPSACLKHSDAQPGRCVLTCEIGPPLTSLIEPLDPAKCVGREDLRCGKAKGPVPVCLPTCGKDEQCGKGRACDPRLSVCVDADKATTGLPAGAKCDLNADPSECAGRCIGFSSGNTACSSPCVLGGKGLASDDCGGVALGLCTFHPTENGAGDVGYCTTSCTHQADCQNPTFFCFGSAGFSESTGKGYCFAPTACPGGQGDCIGPDQMPLPYTCTDTPDGPFCLDTAYPLGDADAGADGGSGGAGGGGAGGAGSSSTGSSSSASSGGGEDAGDAGSGGGDLDGGSGGAPPDGGP